MDTPPIQYVKTSDGVSIAYSEAGEGTPLVMVGPAGFTHVTLSWEALPGAYQSLASRFRALWFDFRGAGLSERGVVDFSLDALVRDVEALVERAGVERLVLAAWASAVPVAIAFAAAHPERVSHLILTDGWASFSDYADSPAYRAAIPLLEIDWHLYTETLGQVLWEFDDRELGRATAALYRACSDPDTHRAIWKAWEEYDVAPLLPLIAVPTLVLHNKNNRLYSAAASQRLTAAISGARLAASPVSMYGQGGMLDSAVPDMIERFVRETSAPPGASELPSGTAQTGTAIILFADIVDSTALTERMGDAAFRSKARDLDVTLRTIIREHSGTAIDGKLLGDGVLAVFSSARQAIEAALASATAGDEAGLPLHLGLHAGDVIREDNNVYGGAVNIAARISGLSAPGEVLVSETVRSLARTSAGVQFEDRGEQDLKGVGEPVRVWVVREAE